MKAGTTGTTYNGDLIQDGEFLTLRAWNNLFTPAAEETHILFQTMDGTSNHTGIDSLHLTPTDADFATNINCVYGRAITGNSFQARDATYAVDMLTELEATSRLTIGSGGAPTSIRGSSITFAGLSNINLYPLASNATLSFPSAIPTTVSSLKGLGITWSDSGAGGGNGRTNFIGYGGAGNLVFSLFRH